MANAVGKLQLVSKNFDAAVEAFDNALELNPELLDSLVSKSMALYFNPDGDVDVANLWAAQVSCAAGTIATLAPVHPLPPPPPQVMQRLNDLGDAPSLDPFKNQVSKIRQQYG